jgi:H-type lectin domain-containing protein
MKMAELFGKFSVGNAPGYEPNELYTLNQEGAATFTVQVFFRHRFGRDPEVLVGITHVEVESGSSEGWPVDLVMDNIDGDNFVVTLDKKGGIAIKWIDLVWVAFDDKP